MKHSKRNIKRAKDENNKKKLVSSTVKTLVSIVSVMLMFGLSWLFGALSIAEAAIVFQWLFVIFSTSQGFLLFLFFCVIGKDARDEWKKLLSCYRYKGLEKKKGTALSSTNKVPKSDNTKETYYTSRMAASKTIRMSVGLMPKSDSIDFDSSIAPLEMSEFSPTTTNFTDTILEEDTSLIFSNGISDSQLPPQILFRLKRPCYDLILEQSESKPSTSPEFFNKESTKIDIIDNFADDHFLLHEMETEEEVTKL